MIINSIMTDEEKKELEHMLSLEYIIRYPLVKSPKTRRKIIYTLTPVLVLASINCYFIECYWMFYVGMSVSAIALLWIIWFQCRGKRFEKVVHEFVWNKSQYNKVEINIQRIKIEGITTYEFNERDRAFLYKNFFFFITNEKKILVLKAEDKEKDELIKIIEEADILFEKREKPFIIYKYCKK